MEGDEGERERRERGERYSEREIGGEMIGVLGHDPALVRLYWARDNLG